MKEDRTMTTLKIDSIRTDGGTQSRAALNPAVVEEYAQTIRDGTDFPPVTVFHDGKKYWLADGFHRVAAYRAAGAVEVEADVRQGSKREAQLFSFGANDAHGLRRTNEDKRRVVTAMLSDKEWSKWSDREIAAQCKVSHTFVAKLRSDLTGNVASEARTYTTKHGTTATMDTAKIGKTDKAAAKAAREAQQAEWDRQREETRRNLNPAVQRAEQAKAANGSHHAAVVGKQPTPPAETPEQIAAHRDELLEENDALRKDVEELTRKLAAYDDRVVLWERAGLDGIEASYKEQIKVLERRVEEATADRAKAIRQRDYWKKQAMSLGYVSPNLVVETEAADAGADEWSPF